MGQGFRKGSTDLFIVIHGLPSKAARTGRSSSTSASSLTYQVPWCSLAPLFMWHLMCSSHSTWYGLPTVEWCQNVCILPGQLALKRQEAESTRVVKGSAIFYWSRKLLGPSTFKQLKKKKKKDSPLDEREWTGHIAEEHMGWEPSWKM